MTYETAAALVARAVEKAVQMKVPVSVAVVDAGGYLLAYGRMDGAALSTVEPAQAKAFTAAFWRKPSGDLRELAEKRPAVFEIVKTMGMRTAFPSPGGLPIRGAGGIGVSGTPRPEDDAEIALAALGACKLEVG